MDNSNKRPRTTISAKSLEILKQVENFIIKMATWKPRDHETQDIEK